MKFFQDMIRQCYDPTNNALRIKTGLSALPSSDFIDAEQCFESLFHAATWAVRAKSIGAASGLNGTELDFAQIVKKVTDEADSTIRYVT
jgi:hypothetical protein